jgi:hypothetical protein
MCSGIALERRCPENYYFNPLNPNPGFAGMTLQGYMYIPNALKIFIMCTCLVFLPGFQKGRDIEAS